jgi:hypothetical protein
MNLNVSNTFIDNKTICLSMIVKNEEANIAKCLTNLVKYFNFEKIVICDTGSSDNTINIINQFFIDYSISGEVLQHKWVDFAYNRTIALEHAYNKTDYVLVFDADDIIEGEFIIPPNLICDQYSLKFGKDFFYYRPCLISNRLKWEYIGILHEYLSLKPDQNIKIVSDTVKGNYYINFGTHGCRSHDPNKYLNDAILLESAINDPSLNNICLKNRYTFYCANSYFDFGKYDKALEMYQIVLASNNWNQEKFYSCMRIGQIFMFSNCHFKAIDFWTESFIYDQERIETIVLLMKHFYEQHNHFMVNVFFHKYINISNISNNFQNINLGGKLFCKYSDLYLIYYYNSISAYYVKDFKTGYESCLYLIENDKYVSLSMDNLQHYINFI